MGKVNAFRGWVRALAMVPAVAIKNWRLFITAPLSRIQTCGNDQIVDTADTVSTGCAGFLKNNDISLLCDLVDESSEKDVIYESLDITKVKKKKIRKKKNKVEKNKKISLKDFMDNFKTLEIGN